MDIYGQVVENIIKEQENIIGPLAVERAKKVQGLEINWQKHDIKVSGDKKDVLDKLVKQYEALFGRTSIEVCREAASQFIARLPKNDIPSALL